MPLIRYIYLYVITLLLLVIFDLIWVKFVMQDLYETFVAILRPEIHLLPVLVFYLVFSAGLLLFVVRPSLEMYAGSYAIAYGGLLGLLAYGTYGLTTYALLQDWPLLVSAFDTASGIVIGALVSGASYFIGRKLWL